MAEEKQENDVEETEETKKEAEVVEKVESAEETKLVEAEKEELEEGKKEVKPSREEETEEIVEERTYTIPLGKAWIMPPNKRAPRAMRILKSFITRHMKLEKRGEEEEEGEEAKKLVITNEVNQKIWSRGIEKPPRKIRIRAAKDKDGVVTVYLAEGD